MVMGKGIAERVSTHPSTGRRSGASRTDPRPPPARLRPTRPASGLATSTRRTWTSTSRSTRTCTVSSRRVLPTSTRPDVAAKSRLDAELVRRGLARSREHAQALVSAGRVRVGGMVATKPATGVDGAASVQVLADAGDDYVSRGAHKLAGALDQLGGPAVADRRCLDAGASTGGFTDVLLRRGAREGAGVDGGDGPSPRSP